MTFPSVLSSSSTQILGFLCFIDVLFSWSKEDEDQMQQVTGIKSSLYGKMVSPTPAGMFLLGAPRHTSLENRRSQQRALCVFVDNVRGFTKAEVVPPSANKVQKVVLAV